MKENSNYILWLPSWYPNKIEPFSGDFIQRHAHAVAMYEKVIVVFLIRDELGIVTKDYKEEIYQKESLCEKIIYYYIPPKKIKILEKLTSFYKYTKIYRKEIAKLFDVIGKPKIVHAYITFKAGLLATWIKNKYRIPFVITEQWTVYLEEAVPNYFSFPFFLRLQVKKIFKEGKSVSVVSNYLGKRLQYLFGLKSFKIIPNVVDHSIFKFERKNKTELKRLIHISLLNYQKNPEHIFKALSIIKDKFQQFKMDVIGPVTKDILLLADNLGLRSFVNFYKEMPQVELVRMFQQADALILYSRYETFGCVLIEANACGVPVIVSDIPVLHENVKEGFNGLFVENENPVALANTILDFFNDSNNFNSENISGFALENYSYLRIGQMFQSWYNDVLKTDKS